MTLYEKAISLNIDYDEMVTNQLKLFQKVAKEISDILDTEITVKLRGKQNG